MKDWVNMQTEFPKTANWLSLIRNGIQYREFMLVKFELRNLLLVCLLAGCLLVFLLASLVFS